jgi:hypothetical protein
MKKQLMVFCLCFFLVTAHAQNSEYPTIDQLGWHITTIAEPEKLKESDVGSVVYLITLNNEGRVQKLKVLSTTFSTRVERAWRKQIKRSTFINVARSERQSDTIEGTLLVTRDGCNKELASDM